MADTQDPQTLADLYQQVLGRAPDVGGLAYWQQQFGDTIDPNEISTFKTAAAPELAQTPYTPTAAPAPSTTGDAPLATKVDNVESAPAPLTIASGMPTSVSNFYQQFYGNANVDPAGLSYWQQKFGDNQIDPLQASVMINEVGKHDPNINTGMTVEDAFKTYLGNNTDQSGIDFWKSHFGSGPLTVSQLSQLTNTQSGINTDSGDSGILGTGIGPNISGTDALRIASVIPSPIQPFAATALAAQSAGKGDYTGALLSGLGAYSGYQGNIVSDTQELNGLNSVSGTDLGGGVVPSAEANVASQAAQNAANARLASSAIAASVAADKGNYVPLLSLGANVMSNPATASMFDMKVNPDIATAFNSVSAVQSVKNNDLTGMLNSAGALSGSGDLKLAGAANNFINAYNSGNSGAIAAAAMAFGTAAGANMTATNAVDRLKSAFGPDTAEKVTPPTGTTITPEGPATNTSAAGPMSGINLAGADNRYEMGGPPIFAGTAKASTVTEPVGYRLMTMDEADARPAGSYYDITQNAWFAPDEGGMTEITNLQNTLSGPVSDGSASAGNLPTDSSTGPASTDAGEIVVTADRPVVNDAGEIVVTADRPVVNDAGEIVVTADRPVVDDAGEIVVTADRPVTEPPSTVTPPPVVTPPTVTPPSGSVTVPKTTKTTVSGGAAAPTSAPSFLPPEPGKFKKISEDFKPLNPLLFALAGVGPLKGTLEEQLSSKEETKKKMPSLADILFAPVAPQEQPSSPYARSDADTASVSSPDVSDSPEQIVPAYAQGGLTGGHPMGEPQFFSQGGLGNMHVQGDGDGTSDSVPAMVAKDEFVLPADVVSSLGNGSSEAGASVLDQFVEAIRQHKHSNQPSELPPQSKGPLEYLSSAMKKGHK